MRHYIGHKVVLAAKIAGVSVGRDVVTIIDEFGITHVYNKPGEFARLRTAVDGDYLVIYVDGYVSISPNAPFVHGYTLLPMSSQSLGVMKLPVLYRTVVGVELQVESDTFDHYMVSFDVGYPVEATGYNCKDPKAVREGDVLVTYPTGRVEFLTRSEFDDSFNEAPAQVMPKVAEPEEFIITAAASNGHYSNLDLIKSNSTIEVLAAYDVGGDELHYSHYEISKSSKTNPDLIVVVGRNADRAPGRIVGYIDQKKQRVDFSDGIGAFKLRVTN